MKQLFKVVLAATAMMCVWSCDKEIPQPEVELEVTAHNISGVWRLDGWNNEDIIEGNFVYIDFVRENKSYTIYQNIDSSVTRKITGKFNIYTNASGQNILRGNYDHTDGTEWSHWYVVSSLTANTMILDAVDPDDTSVVIDRSVYVRDELREDIYQSEY